MIEYLKLPDDPSGYGDFSTSYDNVNFRVLFEYSSEGIPHIGELSFGTCIEYRVSGDLNNQTEMPYDKVFVTDSLRYSLWDMKKFQFIFSGSDFQFFFTAQCCVFSYQLR